MPNSDFDQRRTAQEAAIMRANSHARVLFAGMDGLSMLNPDYCQPIDRASLPSAFALSEALLDAEIDTFDELARYLAAYHSKLARKHSQALWNALCVVNVVQTSMPDWTAIYATLDEQASPADTEEPCEDDAEDDEPAITWSKNARNGLARIASVLELVKTRSSLNFDQTKALEDMLADLAVLQEGDAPEGSWRLELELATKYEDSSGSRTYGIYISERGVGGECYGREWERGVGSDSWTGVKFALAPDSGRGESGDIDTFIAEFRGAVADSSYVVSIEFNGDTIGQLPDPKESDSAGEVRAKQCLCQLVGELQDMSDEDMLLSGQGTGLMNVWDEICVQKQVGESVGWEAYEEIVRGLIAGAVESMTHEQRIELWLLTPEGKTWSDENESGTEQPSIGYDDIIDYLFLELMTLAYEYTNQRIFRYRYRDQS